MKPPGWFYEAAQPRIAGHIGTDAAALWVESRFWYAIAWLLAVPIGLTACLWAELSGPGILWAAAALCWTGAAPIATRSILTGRTAEGVASAHLTEVRGHRMAVSCPITSWEWQWTRALARAENEHAAHIRLAQTAGVRSALSQIIERKRYGLRLYRVALGLVGFLVCFVVGVVLAFVAGQTRSLGVFLVFSGAFAAALVVPYLFRGRFDRALDRYGAEISEELSTA